MNYFLVMVVVGSWSLASTTPLPPFSTLAACKAAGAAWVTAAEQLEGRTSYVCVPLVRPKAKRPPRAGGPK